MPAHLSEYQVARISERILAYRTVGHAEGPPIVLIHALASRSDSWDTTAGALARLGFRVVVPDLRGHGRSEWANSYALEDFEHDLMGLLDALHLDRVDLIGHSLGALLALRIASTAPKRVRRCVIEATPVPPRDEADAESLRQRTSGPWWGRSLSKLGAVRLLRLALFRQFDLRAAGPILRELRSPMPSWWRGIDAIVCPTLLLAGKNDGNISGRIGLLSSRIAGSKAIAVGEGHRLHTNHLQEFMAVVSPFLMTQSPQPTSLARSC